MPDFRNTTLGPFLLMGPQSNTVLLKPICTSTSSEDIKITYNKSHTLSIQEEDGRMNTAAEIEDMEPQPKECQKLEQPPEARKSILLYSFPRSELLLAVSLISDF